MSRPTLRIGFVSTRFAGTDGVSLETSKWCDVLEDLGHECFFFAGQCDHPPKRSRVVPEAHFEFPLVHRIYANLFDTCTRSAETSEAIHDLWRFLTRALREFITDFDLQMVVVENALSLPMNVPLAVALTEVIAETNIATVAHHHDLWWERERFAVNAAEDYLHASFPPDMPSIQHVVINSFGASQLALRTGIRSMLIPNVMDFETPPPDPDASSGDIRHTLGIGHDEAMVEHNYELGRKFYSYSAFRKRLGRRKCGIDTVIRRKGSRRFLFRGIKGCPRGRARLPPSRGSAGASPSRNKTRTIAIFTL